MNKGPISKLIALFALGTISLLDQGCTKAVSQTKATKAERIAEVDAQQPAGIVITAGPVDEVTSASQASHP